MTNTSSAASRSYRSAKGLAALLDFAESSHRRAAALLVLVSLLAFLPGFFRIPPIDRDEAYFAQASKQMVESGNYVDIRYQGQVRYRKPIGIYWLQAAAVDAAQAFEGPAARTTIWLYRIPSLLAAVGAVLATYWCALAVLERRGAVLAALMLAGSVGLGIEAHLAKTDAVLLFTVVAAMGVLACAYLPARVGNEAGKPDAPPLQLWLLAVFWSALAAGILIKGPINLMVVGLAAATLSIVDRSARWLTRLRPLPGVVWMLLLVLPWFVAIYWHAGDTFFVDSVGHDMLSKIGGGQETHGAPPGTYLLLLFITFFPASALALMAVPAVWAARRQMGTRFLLAWLVPSWIVFELVPTKLPNYVLPLYPALAILIAAAIEAKTLSQRPFLTRAAIWWFIVPLGFTGVAIAAAVTIGGDLGVPAWPPLAAAIVCGFFAWRGYRAGGAERGFLRALAGAVFLAIGVYAVILPSLRPAFPSVALAGVLRRADCPDPRAASAGYGEPSLVFLAGTKTLLTDGIGAADFLHWGGCRFAFVEAGERSAFARRAAQIGLHYTSLPPIQGFNISKGERVDIGVYRPAGAP